MPSQKDVFLQVNKKNIYDFLVNQIPGHKTQKQEIQAHGSHRESLHVGGCEEEEGGGETEIPDYKTQKQELQAVLQQRLRKGDTWYEWVLVPRDSG